MLVVIALIILDLKFVGNIDVWIIDDAGRTVPWRSASQVSHHIVSWSGEKVLISVLYSLERSVVQPYSLPL